MAAMTTKRKRKRIVAPHKYGWAYSSQFKSYTNHLLEAEYSKRQVELNQVVRLGY